LIFYCNCLIMTSVIKMKKNLIFHQVGIEPYYKIWHINGEHMICYVHSGQGDMVTDEKNYPLNKGCLYFIGADKFHYSLPYDPDSYERSKLFVSKETLDKILAMLPGELLLNEVFTSSAFICAPVAPEEQREIDRLLEDIHAQAADDCFGEPVLRCLFGRLLIYLAANMTDSLSASVTAMHKVVEYINSHISENLSIDDICGAVHISKYHFCRQFKKTMGLTVMQYILKTRIVAAKSMLEDEALSVSEISDKCGFCSVSYFCRVFKEDSALTPLQYRKKVSRRHR